MKGTGTVRVVAAELTSGPGTVLGLLLVAVALAGGLVPTLPVTGPSWSNPFNDALRGLLWVAPLCAGAVARQVQDYRRRGIAALAASSPRGSTGGALPRVGAVLAWAVLAYLVLLGLFTLRTAHRGWPGWPPLLLALLAGAFLAACAALGWAVGTLSVLRLAAPLLAGALFAAVYAGSYGENWAARLVPVDRAPAYRSFLQPHVRLVWTQVAVLAGITALALSVPLAHRGARRVTGLSAAVVLAGAVLALSKTDPAPTEIRGAPAEPACATGAVTVCLRPENAALLPRSAQALAAAAVALAPYLAVPVRYGEPGIDQRAEQGPGIYVPPADPADPLAFQAAALAAIVPPCPHEAADTAAAMAYGDLLTWAEVRVNGMAGVSPYAVQRFSRILALAVPQQQDWVRRHLVAACPG